MYWHVTRPGAIPGIGAGVGTLLYRRGGFCISHPHAAIRLA